MFDSLSLMLLILAAYLTSRMEKLLGSSPIGFPILRFMESLESYFWTSYCWLLREFRTPPISYCKKDN